MQTADSSTTSVQPASTDIVFACSNCSTSFVVDAAAAGMTLDCQKCGKPTTVPKVSVEVAAENAARISDLQHQLKENESQRTEITSYINQLSIQLHRWQLRLQTLNERQQKLEAELAAISRPAK
jgi:TolA-binding protein